MKIVDSATDTEVREKCTFGFGQDEAFYILEGLTQCSP